MLDHKEAAQIIDEVRAAVKDWRKVASELQIPNKILSPYCGRWDNL
jgi:serine/threonine-protein kinase HipA